MKAKTKFTKLWSILLALAMVVGMLPTMVLAADPTPEFDGTTIYANGYPILIEAGETSGTTIKYDSDKTAPYDYETVVTANNANALTVYAGGNEKTITSASVLMTGGNVGTIFGGGYTYGDSTSVGSVEITIDGGNVGSIYGGGYARYEKDSYASSSVSTSKITVNGGTVNKLCASSRTAGKDCDVSVNDVTISVTGGTIAEIKENDGVAWQFGEPVGWNNVTVTGFVITGGSIASSDIKRTPTNGETTPQNVVKKELTFKDKDEASTVPNEPISTLTTDAGYTYGMTDVKTNANGNIYVWLPDGTSVTGAKSASGDQYEAGSATGILRRQATYTVSFDADGGAGTMTAQTGIVGAYTLPENGFTAPSGKHFKCWSVGGVEKAAGDKITVAADTTVKAVWEITTYTVSFDADGGAGTMTAQTGIVGAYILPENGFTAPSGKHFKCWSVGGVEKAVGATITVTENTTLKAVWEYIEYTLTVTDGTASSATATMGTTVTLTANAAPTGKVFDKWVVESGNITLGNAKSPTTTFTMPAGNVSVKATYVPLIPSVAITGIDTPVSNTALDTEAVCESAGVSNTEPTVTWDSNDSKAGYGKIYTASITLTASEGYKFADSTTVTVNGNPATSVTKNANGTLKVTYAFPATDKHNIEITVDTDVRDGDAAKNPTISSGYEIEFCFFVEDTDKDGVFINKTGNNITLDDRTMVVDKALVEAYAAQSGGRFTYESLMAALKGEFDLDELKTEFTGGYDYSVLAYICHSDNAYFDYDDNKIVTNAIVKVNGKKITDNCLGSGSGMQIMPVAYVFSAAKTYTVSFDANGGSGTMADATGVSGEYTLPANGFTAPEGKQFKCWSVDGVEKAVGSTINVTANTTVKAVWENVDFFVDVLTGAYYYDAVLWAVGNGITDGMTPTTFEPERNCTRAQVVTFMWRVAGKPAPGSTENPFSDVKEGAWYYDAVLWAVENGITDGMTPTTFEPERNCTRAQVVTFMWRLAGKPVPGSTENPFSDVKEGAWYYDAVLWAVENGITNGMTPTTFETDRICNRAHIVTFLYRFSAI